MNIVLKASPFFFNELFKLYKKRFNFSSAVMSKPWSYKLTRFSCINLEKLFKQNATSLLSFVEHCHKSYSLFL
jgi:hypothetical protein